MLRTESTFLQLWQRTRVTRRDDTPLSPNSGYSASGTNMDCRHQPDPDTLNETQTTHVRRRTFRCRSKTFAHLTHKCAQPSQRGCMDNHLHQKCVDINLPTGEPIGDNEGRSTSDDAKSPRWRTTMLHFTISMRNGAASANAPAPHSATEQDLQVAPILHQLAMGDTLKTALAKEGNDLTLHATEKSTSPAEACQTSLLSGPPCFQVDPVSSPIPDPW